MVGLTDITKLTHWEQLDTDEREYITHLLFIGYTASMLQEEINKIIDLKAELSLDHLLGEDYGETIQADNN